jgi:prefoldin subunit 5
MNSEEFNVLPPKTPANTGESLAGSYTFDDLWEDPPEEAPAGSEEIGADESVRPGESEATREEVRELENRKQLLNAEIAALKAEKERLIAEEVADIKAHIERLIGAGVKELEGRKQALEVSIEQLERRRERIRQEMRTSFAGVSQDLAVRVQGFKDYLVGSLQDLAAAAEQLEFSRFETERPSGPALPSANSPGRPYRPSSEGERSSRQNPPDRLYRSPEVNERPPRGSGESRSHASRAFPDPGCQGTPERGFSDQKARIQALLDRYRTRPDYYGPPWQLRRTFEAVHAERVQQWFFKQGGRGAVRGMGSRLQNILVASAAISILAELQGDRFRSLVLANSPERLGEWRRGLQDCLGISRADFGPERGVVLFESPEALIQKAERLLEEGFSPLIVIDDTEERLNFALLQFPYWLAFTPDPQQNSSYWY